jgi:hypothetical protein
MAMIHPVVGDKMDQEIGGKNRRSTIMRCHSLLIEPLTLDPWRYVTPTPGRYAARGYSGLTSVYKCTRQEIELSGVAVTPSVPSPSAAGTCRRIDPRHE